MRLSDIVWRSEIFRCIVAYFAFVLLFAIISGCQYQCNVTACKLPGSQLLISKMAYCVWNVTLHNSYCLVRVIIAVYQVPQPRLCVQKRLRTCIHRLNLQYNSLQRSEMLLVVDKVTLNFYATFCKMRCNPSDDNSGLSLSFFAALRVSILFDTNKFTLTNCNQG